MRLLGKRAWITGAAGALGAETARVFAREGARLALVDLRAGPVEALAAELGAKGAEAVAIAADISVEAEVARAIADAEAALGGLDVVFNNAGIVHPQDEGPEETPLAAWEATLAVNLTGVFLGCKYGVPALLRAGGGAIVNTGSVVAHRGSAFPQIAYGAAKGGVEAMTREIAILYGRRGVRANCVSPGPVRTDLTAAFFDSDEKWRARRAYMPMGRLGRPGEIAEAVAFLASDAASYVTGASLNVDGGIHAAYVVRDELGGSSNP